MARGTGGLVWVGLNGPLVSFPELKLMLWENTFIREGARGRGTEESCDSPRNKRRRAAPGTGTPVRRGATSQPSGQPCSYAASWPYRYIDILYRYYRYMPAAAGPALPLLYVFNPESAEPNLSNRRATDQRTISLQSKYLR